MCSCCRSRSPRTDGFDREAALLAGADDDDDDDGDGSDASAEEGRVEAPIALAAISDTGGDLEADSRGYEGDVGESAKLTPSVRRPASVVVVASPGLSAKTVGFACAR